MMVDVAHFLLGVLEPNRLVAIFLYGVLRNGACAAQAKMSGWEHARGSGIASISHTLLEIGARSISLLAMCLGLLAEGDRWLTRWIKRTFRIDRGSAAKGDRR